MENTTWSHDPYLKGRKVIYRCFPGYEEFGGMFYKTCSKDLLWVGADPICLGQFSFLTITGVYLATDIKSLRIAK